MKIIVIATPKLTQWGKFSLTVQTIRPSGEGALKKSFELLKAKLKKEGLFALDRKRLLPHIPQHIAVITSMQAAGYADFLKIINDRWGGLRIDVAHVQVQGAEAPDQIIRAIKYLNEQKVLPEVLIIIRGGGSADDLLAFNDERLARTIASSRIPTLVGVGHETDNSLADLVADVRAATPSNAAQLLIPDRQELIRAVFSKIQSMLPRTLQAIDLRHEQVRANLNQVLVLVEQSCIYINDRLYNLRRLLVQVDPSAVLKRGYVLLRGQLKIGSRVEIETYRAIIKARIEGYHEK